MTTTNKNKDDYKNIWNSNSVSIFFKNFSIGFAGIIVFVIFGTTGLFMTKVSESITDTDNDNDNPMDIGMNTKYLFGLNGLAFWDMFLNDKVKFEQLATFKGDEVKVDYKSDENTKIFTDFFFDAYNETIEKSFTGIKNTFGLMSGLNESVMMLLFGMFGLILLPLFFIYNYLWSFVCIIESFMKIIVTNPKDWFKGFGSKKPEPEHQLFLIPVMKEVLLFLPKVCYILMIFVCVCLSLFIMPLVTTITSILKMLTVDYDLKNENNNNPEHYKNKSLGGFIVDVFKHKKQFWLGLTVLNLFICANDSFGNIGVTSAAVAFVVLAIGGVFKTCVSKEDKDMFITLVDTNYEQGKSNESTTKIKNITSLLQEYNNNISDNKIQELIKSGKDKTELNEILNLTNNNPELKNIYNICNKTQLKWVFKLLQILHPSIYYYDDDAEGINDAEDD